MLHAEENPVPTHFVNLEIVRLIVRGSRLAQGLPEKVSDPSVLARLAVLVTGGGK